jgi:hypothetical protein
MSAKRFVLWAAVITVLNVLIIQAVATMLPEQEMSAQEKKMMEQMAKYGTPGKEHELLKKYVGDWTVDIKMWQDPAGQPQMSTGTMKSALLFDGRYVKCDFQGTMGGMKFQGLEVIAYDLFQRKYTTFWIDSWSTAFMTTTGSLDMSGKVLTETGTYPDPMTDGQTQQKVKNVTTFMDDGRIKYEMYMAMPDGKEAKSMELVYARKM